MMMLARRMLRLRHGISSADFDETFKTNVYAMFWLTKAAVSRMGPGSTIINTASVNAYDPGENIIDYAATKGAIMIFTKGLAKQLPPGGSASTPLRQGRCGRLSRSPGANRRARYRPLARTRRWAALASLRNWRPFTSCLRLPNPVTRLAKCSPRSEAAAALESHGSAPPALRSPTRGRQSAMTALWRIIPLEDRSRGGISPTEAHHRSLDARVQTRRAQERT